MAFALEIDGFPSFSIVEIIGLRTEQDVVRLTESTADGRVVVRQRPGRPRGGECTVTRRVTASGDIDAWLAQVRADADGARRNGVVVLYDADLVPVKRYRLVNVWPRALAVVGLVAGNVEGPLEHITLVYDAMEPVTT
ncbi:phage tail protein [Mumia sp. zg.B17]|uniref:phage tail protein n=1 Tax=unclassified Mumia TaxID=2621872 RepID=UPI001C6E447D|nr:MULTISPECIES: phage tail protein [unclassified Mumia]MBW9207945.1 phage tail protein [Mumia sp. zg.B17]MDD9350329.1 phage tail protein [Mumia sp.]